MIETVSLTKRFQSVTAVDGLNLTVTPGEIFGLLGPNGSGKTTTLKLLTGLLRPSSGCALIGGIDIQKDPLNVKRMIGYVPDQPYVYPLLTGQEYLRLIGDLYHSPIETQRRRIPELLSLFDLQDRAHELVETYSHGMRQKLVLAGVLLHEPKVILMDEPMVGLDPKSIRLLKSVLGRLAQDGVTLLLSTHILEFAEKLCHRIGILQNGRLTYIGTPDDLQKKACLQGSLEDVFLKLTAESGDVAPSL
ncbi:MAG TPA: ABC transporter ATP-binding protein [Elusimicrobiota bacterium]|nr:ABC transporter ATP-binding protein [Elusimicrobiota bacterium]